MGGAGRAAEGGPPGQVAKGSAGQALTCLAIFGLVPIWPGAYLAGAYLAGVGDAVCSALGRYCSGIGEPGNHFW
ncbi:hypothetical protein FBY36_1858 [Arthrobacter sp. SLBN-122]|nr:hypothetical protein FBY36_1858 [Arthrobacter sp. SLBN-122]